MDVFTARFKLNTIPRSHWPIFNTCSQHNGWLQLTVIDNL
ncbi:hypothetical protein O59_003411 [Cellvibrio sp. BR]|nr:hypothetical protein O59_003411 [Cellvibrio sp. BR]